MVTLAWRLKGLCVALLLLASPAWAQVTTELFGGQPVVAGEVLIRLRTEAVLTQIAGDQDLVPLKRVGRGDIVLVRSKSRPAADLVREWSNHPSVAWAEPNYMLYAVATPNDPSFGALWGLRNTGQVMGGVAGTPGADIDAEAAWDITTGSRANVVGVIDSGVDYTHPDLAANMWSAPAAFTVTIGGQSITCPAGSHGFNAINRTCNPMDDNGHGTHVAGTIGAVGNNGIGVAGVNWTASMMGLKFLGASGSGSTANAIDTIQFAIQVKQRFGAQANVRVLNNSWGGGGYSQALFEAITAADAAGMLFVAAAGNENRNNDVVASYPANYPAPNVISVASTTNRDLRSGFSNWGANTVHLGAPGSSILSTFPGNTYGYASGTSMASPHVAGAAALVLAACDLTTAALKQNLLANAEPVAALAGLTITGARLNVAASVQACGTPQPPGFTLSATPPARSIAPGLSTSYTLSVAPVGGFTGAVDLAIAGVPAGATALLDPAAVPGGSGASALTIVTTAGIAPGTYPLTVTATSGALVRTASLTLTVLPPSNFTIAAQPSTRTIAPGSGTAYLVTVSRGAGFTAPVSFEVAGLPAGVSGSFSTQDTTGSQSIMNLTSTTTVAAGTYALTITATGGGLSRTTSVSLTVTGGASPNFAVSVTPASQTITPGGATSFTVGLARSGGFAAEVSFSVSGLPPGATPTLTPASTAGSTSTLAISTTMAAAGGTYPLTITGAGGGLTRTATATLVISVPDYSLSASPASQTVTPGGSAGFAVTVTRVSGFADAVSFSVSGLPAGASGSFAPASTTGTSSTLTVTTTSGVAPGTYPLTVTGTAGTQSRTTAVTLVVNAAGGGGFTLSVSPATKTIARGQTTTFSLYITRDAGFTGPVSFSVTGLPSSGIDAATFIMLSPTASQAGLRIVTNAGATTGTYPLTITGSSGSLSQSVTATLVITP